MRHVVSLVKDEQAHFAYVDDETGELVQFADLLVPDPAHFGMQDAAALGTALVDYLGLNGSRRQATVMTTVGSGIEARRRAAVTATAEAEEQTLALPAEPPKTETATERRRRLDRERWHAKQQAAGKTPTKRPGVGRGAPGQGPTRYVTFEEVMAVVNQYPEGIRPKDIAARLWRLDGHEGRPPQPFYQAVNNRFVAARVRAKKNTTPLPFRTETRPVLDKNGKWNGNEMPFYAPLGATQPAAAQPEQPTDN